MQVDSLTEREVVHCSGRSAGVYGFVAQLTQSRSTAGYLSELSSISSVLLDNERLIAHVFGQTSIYKPEACERCDPKTVCASPCAEVDNTLIVNHRLLA
jgi:hypothetical protein